MSTLSLLFLIHHERLLHGCIAESGEAQAAGEPICYLDREKIGAAEAAPAAPTPMALLLL